MTFTLNTILPTDCCSTPIPPLQWQHFDTGRGQSAPGPSDGAVVRLPPTGLGQRLHHEEGDGAQEAEHHQDEQLPVQQQVVAVGERHRRHDGLWGENQECLEESLTASMNGRLLRPSQ